MQLNKKTIVRAVLCVAVVTALGYSFTVKSETKLLPFQGKLTDANGQVIPDKAIVVQFKMYDAPVGGNAKWNGEVQMLTVNGGLVNTTLGTKASLKNVDFSTPTYLEITIDANGDDQIGPEDPPLLPRQSIIPAVYAVQAGDAKTLSGYDWSSIFGTNDPTGKILGNKLADGSITGTQIANKTITSTQLANNAVTATQIKAGAVTTDKIANKAIKSNQIDDGAVTTNKIANGAITTEKIAEKSITTELMGERKRVVASETAAPVGSIATSKAMTDIVSNGYSLKTLRPSYEQVPGMSLKLKTSGRPVMIILQGGYFETWGHMNFKLKRDSTDIHSTNVGHSSNTSQRVTSTPSSVITFVDFEVPKGEHQYSLYANKVADYEIAQFYGGIYLLAFEL